MNTYIIFKALNIMINVNSFIRKIYLIYMHMQLTCFQKAITKLCLYFLKGEPHEGPAHVSDFVIFCQIFKYFVCLHVVLIPRNLFYSPTIQVINYSRIHYMHTAI